jgi:integrase
MLFLQSDSASELVNLKIQDVDFTSEKPNPPGKEKDRVVPLVKQAEVAPKHI